MKNYIENIMLTADISKKSISSETIEFVNMFFPVIYKDVDEAMSEHLYSVEDFNEILEDEKPSISVETELQVIYNQAAEKACSYIRLID